jgi:hypothetical protein
LVRLLRLLLRVFALLLLLFGLVGAVGLFLVVFLAVRLLLVVFLAVSLLLVILFVATGLLLVIFLGRCCGRGRGGLVFAVVLVRTALLLFGRSREDGRIAVRCDLALQLVSTRLCHANHHSSRRMSRAHEEKAA